MAENTEVAAAPKKSKLKLIIMLVVVIGLAIGLSVAGTLWFLKGAGDGDSAAQEQPEAEVFQASQYFVMAKPLVAALQAEGRQRYGQVHLAFSAREAETLAALEKHLPLVRSELLAVLGARQFEELRTPEGRDQLISDMLTTVNQVLEAEGEQPIEQILFRNFVLQ